MQDTNSNKCLWIIGGFLVSLLLAVIIILLVVFARVTIIESERYGPIFEPNDGDHADQLIQFKRGRNGTWGPIVEKLNDFLQDYVHPSSVASEHMVMCTWDRPPENGTFCDFGVAELARGINYQIYTCTREANYGYERGSPCILIHPSMEKCWQPEFYMPNDELPSEMPQKLQNYIRHLGNSPQFMTLWMTCEGQYAADKEWVGPIDYSARGFRYYHLMGRDVPGYLSPIISVHLIKPKAEVTISVECRMWAKNIPEGQDTVRFDILID